MKRITVLAALLAAISGCGSDSGDEARLRLLHVAPDVQTLDLALDGATVVEAVPYGQVSEFVPASTEDSQDVQVFASGLASPVYDANRSFSTGRYTLIVSGELAEMRTTIEQEDEEQPPFDQINVRIGQYDPRFSSVSVYLTAPEDRLSDVLPLIERLSYRALTPYRQLRNFEQVRLRVTRRGESAVIYDSGPISLAGGENYTFAIFQSRAPGAPIAATLFTDR